MDHKALGNIFQEIFNEFSEMNPTKCPIDRMLRLRPRQRLSNSVEELSVLRGDILICRRMKLRGMLWSRDKADNVLNIRILILNGKWDEFWKKHKAA